MQSLQTIILVLTYYFSKYLLFKLLGCASADCEMFLSFYEGWLTFGGMLPYLFFGAFFIFSRLFGLRAPDVERASRIGLTFNLLAFWGSVLLAYIFTKGYWGSRFLELFWAALPLLVGLVIGIVYTIEQRREA